MLVLSRRLGERIQIGENTTVTVVRITKRYVRLGISAPDDVTVDREEVRNRRSGPVDLSCSQRWQIGDEVFKTGTWGNGPG